MSNLFGIGYLINSEENTRLRTNQRLKGIYDHLPSIIDTFFKIQYYEGELKNVESAIGGFQSFCSVNYTQAPYTFWTIYNLYSTGYYLEGLILFRHLLEAFAQMRYFEKYPEKLGDHIISKRRVKFKQMFDEFSEGYYQKYYGSQFSEAVHGMVMKDIYRCDRESTAEGRVILGCEYNEDHATYLINNLIPILFGFLNFFIKYFPQNTLPSDYEVCNNYIEGKKWLELCMMHQKEQFPKSKDFYMYTDKLIYY